MDLVDKLCISQTNLSKSKDLRVYKCWFEDYEVNEERNQHGVRVERDGEADHAGVNNGPSEPGSSTDVPKDDKVQAKPKPKPKPKSEPKAKTAEQLARAATRYNFF